MNNSFKTIFFCCAFSCALLFSKKIIAQEVAVNFQVFYNELSPYGTWVNSPQYGYVWIPSVDAGFQPYSTNGYWLLTEEGWTWVSNYAWGWAPFHYGRWYNDDVYGAMWMPDNEWGPGWVNWRQNDGYYGWCAMSPIGGSFVVRNEDWTFVHSNHFGQHDWHEHVVNRNQNVTIINNTTVINNNRADGYHHVVYNAGPDRMQVEHFTGQKIMPVAIKNDSKHEATMNNNELHLFRPSVEKNNTTTEKPSPEKVSEMKDIKPMRQKTNLTEPKPSSILPKENPNAADLKPLKKQGAMSIHQDEIPAHRAVEKPAMQENKSMRNNVPMEKLQHQNTLPSHKKNIPPPPNQPRNNDGEKQVPHNVPPTMQPHERQLPHQNNLPAHRPEPMMQRNNQPPQPHQQAAPMQQNHPFQNRGGEEHRPH